MTKNQKIIIFVVGGIVILCLASCVVGFLLFRGVGSAITNSVIKSTVEVQSQAQQIATIDMPAGYSASEGFNIFGVTMAIFKSSSSDVFIMLMQMPKTGDLTQADIDLMQQTFNRQYSSRGYQMHVVSTKDMTIRDKPAKMIVSEGTGSGKAIRQVVVFFTGNNGLAALFVTGPQDQWDAQAYDAMIRSIR